MILEENLRKIGRLLKPHGINGELVMQVSEDVDPASLPCVMLRLDGIFVPFFIGNCRPKSSETDLISLDGVSNEVEAAGLCPNDVFAEISALPEDVAGDGDGFYAEDMVGFEVIADGEKIGKIIGIEDSTDNFLFIIEKADGEERIGENRKE